MTDNRETVRARMGFMRLDAVDVARLVSVKWGMTVKSASEALSRWLGSKRDLTKRQTTILFTVLGLRPPLSNEDVVIQLPAALAASLSAFAHGDTAMAALDAAKLLTESLGRRVSIRDDAGNELASWAPGDPAAEVPGWENAP